MKILHFFPWTSWGSLGGTEKYIIEISKRQGLTNDVFIAFPSDNTKTKLNNEKTYREIILNNMNPKGNRFIGLGIVPSFSIIRWMKLLKKEKFDIIHFHCYEPYLLWLIIASKFFSVKVVLTSHIVNFTCINGKLANPNNEICDGRIDVVRCSKCSLSTSKKKDKSKTHLKFVFTYINILIKKINLSILKLLLDLIININDNYNGVLLKNGFQSKKLRVVKPINLSLGDQLLVTRKFEKVKVVYVGRISVLKGLDVLLNAFLELDKDFFSLDIYGPNCDLNIDDYKRINIVYKGEFHFNETDKVLQNYDVLCLPSITYEMTPLSIIEAVNNGLYVIGTDAPGIAELVLNNGINGKIVRRNSKDDLIQSFNELKDGFNDNSNNKFKSFESIADEIENEYMQLLQ